MIVFFNTPGEGLIFLRESPVMVPGNAYPWFRMFVRNLKPAKLIPLSMEDNDQINKEIAELEALKASASRWKIGSTLFTLVVVIVCVLSVVQKVNGLANDGPQQQEMMAELKAGIEQTVVPEVRIQAQRTIENLKPAINEELDNLDARSEEVAQRFMRELKLMEDNLSTEAERILADSFGAELEARDANIRKLHPELTPEKVKELVNKLYDQLERKVNDISDELFTPHLAALGGIVGHIDTIRDTEPKGEDDEVDVDLALIILDIVRNEFGAVEDELSKSL